MNLPFLRHLPSLGKRPLHRIISTASGSASGAEAALRHLLAELPELLMAAVVTLDAGQVLASYTSQENLWPSNAALAWAAVVQQLRAAQVAQGQGQEQVEEVLTTLASQLHLVQLLPGGQHLLYLVVDAHDTNLALAREITRQAIAQLTISN